MAAWQWVIYDARPIELDQTDQMDSLWLLLLLIAFLSVARKAFLRYALRSRMTAQYASLCRKVALSKGLVYRLSRAAYSLPPPLFEDLPESGVSSIVASATSHCIRHSPVPHSHTHTLSPSLSHTYYSHRHPPILT
jgi:hypothetical protein